MAENREIIKVIVQGAKKSEKQLKGVNARLMSMAKKAGLAAGAYFGARGLIAGFNALTEQGSKLQSVSKAFGNMSTQSGLTANALQKFRKATNNTVDDVTLSQIHPVLDKRNKVIQEPNAFDINTSIQRCLVKAIALHGLGLGVYAGEDLPDLPAGNSQHTPKPMPIKPPQANNIPPKPAESTNGKVVGGVQMEFGKYSGFYVSQIDNVGYLNYLTDKDGTHKLQEFLAKGNWPDNYCNDIMEAAGKQLFKLQNPGIEIEKSPVGVGFTQKDVKAEEYNQEEPETFEKKNKIDDEIPF